MYEGGCMMKRISMVMALCLILTLMAPVIPVMADSTNTYELSELDLSVSIPDKYSVITRESEASDSVFSKFGITREDTISHFEASHIYLNALEDSESEEIVVTMTAITLSNFNTMSDTAIKMLGSALVEEYKTYNIELLNYEVYQQIQTKFLQMHFYDSANSVYGMQYYTVVNGRAMNFTMRSYSGDISDEQLATIQGVVDSIQYNTLPAATTLEGETEAFVYTDAVTGVTFQVPANWVQDEMNEERQFLDAKFVSSEEAGLTILYGSTDLWEQMSDTEKIGCERSDIDNSILFEMDVAEMLGMSSAETSFVTYNGIEYCHLQGTQSTSVADIDFSVEMTYMLYVHDGWVYMFQFSGTSDSVAFGDFVRLLNSVEYPSTSDIIIDSDNALGNVYNLAYKIGRIVAMLVVALPIIIVIIVIVIVRKKKAKKAESDSAASLQQAITYDQTMQNANAGETVILNADIMQQQMYVQPHLIRIRNNERIELSKSIFGIGKDMNYADYCIMDNSAISRMHANIISRDGEYFVVDNNSTNHTYVNGMMIPSNVEVQITNGARIHFADEEFEFKVE